MINKLLEIRNCSVRDQDDKALISNVTFSVGKNERVGMIGESGSGKSMTIKALLGIVPPNLRMNAETIKLGGVDLSGCTDRERKEIIGTQIGFVPQNTVAYLHPLIKIKKQIADSFMTYRLGTAAQAQQKATELLRLVGITEPERIMNSFPGQLSGGMRQRVNIAMALMCNPRLIVADEPTTALDCIVQKQVTELFFRLSMEKETAVLMVSHNLNMLKKYCDRIIVMYAGQIVEMGETEQIFRNPGHPYTRALIDVIPKLNQDRSKPLTEIPGYVPEIERDRKDCLFYDRCKYATERCRQELPLHTDDTHYVKCIL